MATISCPKCNSQAELGGFAAWQWIVAICGFPIGLLAFLAGRQPSSCPHCGHRWTGGSVTPLVVERTEIRSEIPAPPPPVPSATSRDVYAELMKLDELRAKGILTQEEFDAQKNKLLST